MTTLYGIPNCATVKKARAWLDEKQVPHAFVNFKTEAPAPEQLARWLDAVGADILINRKGTTWRKLSPAEQAAADSREGAIALMQAQPSNAPCSNTKAASTSAFPLNVIPKSSPEP